MLRQLTRRLAPWLALLVSCAWGYLIYLNGKAYWTLTSDDAAISFAYAQNIAQGYGLVHSPGAEPVEGFSNPTWVFLLSLFSWFGVENLVVLSKVLSVICLGVTSLIVWKLPSVFQRRRPILADLFAPFWLASSPVIILWTFSGLENAIFAALIVAMLFQSMREDRGLTGSRWSGLLAASVIWCRPEGIGYAMAVAVGRLIVSLRRAKLVNPAVKVFMTWVITGAIALLLWRYLNFNELLPNTYFAKVGGARDPKPWYMLDSAGMKYVSKYLSNFTLEWLPYCLVALLFCRRWLRSLGFFGCLFLSVFFPIYVGGDWMGSWRFLFPFIVLASPIISIVNYRVCRLLVWGLKGRLSNRWRLRLHRVLVLSTGVAVLVSVQAPRAKMFKKRPKPGWVLEENARVGHAFHRLKTHLGLERASLAIADVGAPSLQSDLLIHDLGELCSRALSRIKSPKAAQEFLLGELAPDFITFAASWRSHRAVKGAPEITDGFVELPRGAFFPLWPWGYAGVRRRLVAPLWTTLAESLDKALGPFRVLGIVGRPQTIVNKRTSRLQVLMSRVKKIPAKSNPRLDLVVLDANKSVRPLSAQKVHSGFDLYAPEKWRLFERVRVDIHFTAVDEGMHYLRLRWRDKQRLQQTAMVPLFVVENRGPDYGVQIEVALNQIQNQLNERNLTAARVGLDALEAWLPRPQYDPFPELFASRFLSKKEAKKRNSTANRVLKTQFDRHLVQVNQEPDYAKEARSRLFNMRGALFSYYCQLSLKTIERPTQGYLIWQHAISIARTRRCGFEEQLADALEENAIEHPMLEPLFRLNQYNQILSLAPDRVRLRGEAESLRKALKDDQAYLASNQRMRSAAYGYFQTNHEDNLSDFLEAALDRGELGLVQQVCRDVSPKQCETGTRAHAISALANCLLSGREHCSEPTKMLNLAHPL